MAQLTLGAVNNKSLFSDYYLENLIKNTSEWKKEDHKEVFEKIKNIYQAELPFLEGLNESQLEERFFRRVFQIILPEFEVQATTKKQDFPDYAFFPDEHSLKSAHEEKGKRSFFVNAFAIGEVKRWGVELDKFGRDRHDKRKNPSFQIWLYLHETEPKWGILSNGRKWRLYHQDRIDSYYEVDLVTLLENGDVEDFKYFYYFFRKEAFVPYDDSFLDQVLKDSLDYAREVGDNLKENVYRAMKKIADGFLHWSDNNLDPQDERTRVEVQKSSMRLLYRFLFLLYAEGKGLLDLKDERYRNMYSFYRLKKEVAEKKDGPTQDYYLPVSTSLWYRLKDLFRLIDQGSEALGIPKEQFYIPSYNGGLFDTRRNPNLENWVIGDKYLADAIDLLARTKTNGGIAFVDYSTLEIKHLGSIYEGLLEYKLKIAEEDLVVKGQKKREWVSLEEYNKERKNKKGFDEFDEFDRVRAGESYLATDKGERKATGSYYTPGYIVDYIVKNTVGPVVEEKWKEAQKNGKSLVDTTLSVKVLDPATGSGHFLVGAIDFLAPKLLEAVDKDIESGLIEEDEHLDLDWAKREVVSNCIYGVDLNDLAVELAKVSLWLTTISKDKPLSFLDHRIKQGNSLIGADLEGLPFHPFSGVDIDQRRLDIPSGFIEKLLSNVKEIESIDDDRLENIRRKEEIFQQFKNTREYDMIKTLTDVKTSIFFGNEVDVETYGKYSGDAYHSSEKEWRKRRNKWFAKKGREIAEENKFFHWELEYPEIFFEKGKLKEKPGFDVVVGNPPYVRVQELDHNFVDFTKIVYSTSWKRIDISVIFIELGFNLLNSDGYLGYITSNQFLIGEYGREARKLLRNHLKINVDFSDLSVFEEATTYTSILIVVKETIDKLSYYKVDSLPFEPNKISFSKIPFNKLSDDSWELANTLDLNNKKVSRFITSLGDVAKVDYGLISGDDSTFILHKKEVRKLEMEHWFLRPYTRPAYFKRYGLKESPLKIIYPYDNEGKLIPEKELKERAPNIYNYLLKNKNRLQNRQDSRYTIEEKGLPWYCLIRPSTPKVFEKPKIIYYDVGNLPNFIIDFEGYYYGGGTSHSIRSDYLDLRYILSLLNSKLLCMIIRSICPIKAGGARKFGPNYISTVPIRIVNFSTELNYRKEKLEEAKQLYQKYMREDDLNSLIDLLDNCLQQNEDKNTTLEEEKSDIIYDFLIYLVDEIMRVNKEKNQKTNEFIDWLEMFIGEKIDNLTNKSKIKQYYNFDFDYLFNVLKKNKKKVNTNVLSIEFHTNLKEAFEKNVTQISSLSDKIYYTDKLIDQIVYKLYGLTDEEIEVVEQSI